MMLEILLCVALLILMIAFLILENRQFEAKMKQSYDEGFRDGVSAMGRGAHLTVGEIQALQKEMD
jgi:hypothetical protein